MPTYEYTLSELPTEPRAKELWLQHAIGFIIFEDARQYAIDRIPETHTDDQREAAITAIDDALYGMMMIFDGVTGGLRNDKHLVSLQTKALLQTLDGSSPEETIDLCDEGDGMCMGFHSWKENDYGKVHPAIKNKST